jgi:8-oxo-dGTP pyrophosphatase MutT (NUDIX family)
MINIFYNYSKIVLSEKELNLNNSTKIRFSDKISLKKSIFSFLNSETNQILNIFGNNEKYIFDYLLKEFKYIIAAGGVVSNDNQDILLIYKRNMWDLPKGKIDKGETPENAAIREVSEECGISINNLMIKEALESTFHIYFDKNKYYLKETKWFLMKTIKDEELSPQIEEGITKITWKNKSEIHQIINSIYPSLQNILSNCL